MKSIEQTRTLIVNSTIFAIYWWTIAPDLLHSLPWSYVYLASIIINSITLFAYILFSRSQFKNPILPYAKTVIPTSPRINNTNNSVNVSVNI